MFSRFKRFFAYLAVFVLIGSSLPVSAAEADAARESQVFTETYSYVNPLYADEIEVNTAESQSSAVYGSLQYASNSFKTREDAAKYMNAQMLARVGTISFEYYTSNSAIVEEMKAIFDAALYVNADTDFRSGDYLKFNFGSYYMSVRYSYDRQTGKYWCNPTFQVSYLNITAAQEKVTEERIAAILKQLNLTKKNKYEKILAIYNYICNNVTYDYKNLNDDTYLQKHSTYAAVVDKTAVCQGYATMFYRMCREAGIDARVISGLGNGGPHAWNIVRIGNKYYNLDSTWDASSSKYSYFLKSNKDFPGHIRDQEYTTTEFNLKHPMATSSYNPNNNKPVTKPGKVSSITVSKGSVDNCLRITWSKVTGAEGYEIQARTGSSYNTVADVEGVSSLAYAHKGLTIGKNYYYRVRAYKYDNFGEKVYGDFSTVKGANVSVAPPSFSVVGVFGGREVTFKGTSDNVRIYYSKKGSNITTKDPYVVSGKKVLFTAYYGTIYAKAYDVKTGTWSQVSRLILKIPKVNDPTVSMSGRYATVKCSTPGSYLVYTLDGSNPSPTHGTRIWNSAGRIYVPAGKKLKVMAIRSCFSNSAIIQK